MKNIQTKAFMIFAMLFVCGICFTTSKAQCRDPWINEVVVEVMGRAPQGRGDMGECSKYNYGGGNWSDRNDLKRKVWARFAVELASTDENQSNNRICLDTQSRNAGSKIVAYPCHGGESQQFIINSNGTIRIFNDTLCLDGKNGSGRDLIFAQCTGVATQRWYLDRIPTADNVPKTIEESDQRRFNSAPGQIQNVANGHCIDIKGGSINSREIVMWQCKGEAINRAWNQMFGAASMVPSGKAYVFFRTYQPAYQGHAAWAFRLADGRWIAGSQDGFSTPTIEQGKDNGWNMTVFADVVDPITKLTSATGEQQMIDYFGGNDVYGQKPSTMRFSPYDRYKTFDIYNAHPATAIQVAVRSKDWGYGVFGNNCVDQTVKILRAYGVSPLPFPTLQPFQWYAVIGGTEANSFKYNKNRARQMGCITCF